MSVMAIVGAQWGDEGKGKIIDELADRAAYVARYQGGGNAGQALNDLTNIRQFLTGNALFAFFDAPWFPFYLIVIFLFEPTLGQANDVVDFALELVGRW